MPFSDDVGAANGSMGSSVVLALRAFVGFDGASDAAPGGSVVTDAVDDRAAFVGLAAGIAVDAGGAADDEGVVAVPRLALDATALVALAAGLVALETDFVDDDE